MSQNLILATLGILLSISIFAQTISSATQKSTQGKAGSAFSFAYPTE